MFYINVAYEALVRFMAKERYIVDYKKNYLNKIFI